MRPLFITRIRSTPVIALGPVGDDDDDPAALPHAHDGLSQRFIAFRIEVCVRLVEHDQEWIAIEGARQRNALRLPSRQGCPVLADLGFVAGGQSDDQIVDPRRLGGGNDQVGIRVLFKARHFLARRCPPAVRRLAASSRCGRAERFGRPLIKRGTIELDPAADRAPHPDEEPRERGFAGGRGSD